MGESYKEGKLGSWNSRRCRAEFWVSQN